MEQIELIRALMKNTSINFLLGAGTSFRHVEGTDTDRKGYQHGIEYDEIELLSFTAISLTNIDVVDIDLHDEMITINSECKVILEFSCTFLDETFGDFSTHGTMKETHNTMIPVIINASFEHDDENVNFDIYSLDVNISNIKLNQYTLKEGSRTRTDDPNRYCDDNESANNSCPDCGCEMTFETESGYGFCVNCAPNH